jgi:hypothetical protein
VRHGFTRSEVSLPLSELLMRSFDAINVAHRCTFDARDAYAKSGHKASLTHF